MKNKTIAALLIVSMLSGLTACGSKEPSASDLTANRTREIEEIEEPEEKETETEEKEEKEAATGIVFGSDEAKGYDGFEYLMEELISTSNTKSGNKMTLSVFVPDGDYPSVSGSYATSERMGVMVDVDIDPYLRYDYEDYTVSENLEDYVEEEIEYSSYIYGVEVGEVKEVGDDIAVCELTYMQFDSYDGSYAPYYQVYCLKELGDNVMGLVDICIMADDTTGKTKNLLAELSSFYEIEIGWDESFGETKRAAFENSDEFNADAFNLGFMSFELPEGWEKDEYWSDSYDIVFAPGGDADLSADCLIISQVTEAFGMIDMFLENMDEMAEILEEEIAEEEEEYRVTIDDIGMTFLGHTLKMEAFVRDEEEAGAIVLYFAEDDTNLYSIYAYTMLEDNEESDRKEGVSAQLEEALQMFFDTGRVVDRRL